MLYIKPKTFFIPALVTQTVLSVLILRYASIQQKKQKIQPITMSAVILAELFKLIGSVLIQYIFYNNKSSNLMNILSSNLFSLKNGLLNLIVPAFLYSIQNNLTYIALSNLTPTVYQSCYQLRILITALLSVVLLRKNIYRNQWIALMLLTLGIVLVNTSFYNQQNNVQDDLTNLSKDNTFLGYVAVFSICLTSAFSSVYFEKMVKRGKVSVWVKNIQLAFLSLIICTFLFITQNGFSHGLNYFFVGYNIYSWIAVMLQSIGGLIIAAVIYYSDNVVKCLANTLGITLTALLSHFFFREFIYNIPFFVGITAVLSSLILYHSHVFYSKNT